MGSAFSGLTSALCEVPGGAPIFPAERFVLGPGGAGHQGPPPAAGALGSRVSGTPTPMDGVPSAGSRAAVSQPKDAVAHTRTHAPTHTHRTPTPADTQCTHTVLLHTHIAHPHTPADTQCTHVHTQAHTHTRTCEHTRVAAFAAIQTFER